MGYVTTQGMIDRFGRNELTQLTDTNATGDVDSAALQKAIDDASAFIDAHLSRYALPLSPVPAVLTRYCGDVARYYLYDDAVTDAVKTRYEDAEAFLSGVAKGTRALGVDAAGVPPAATNAAQMVGGGRVFARSDDY